jgi:hypothetical protein
VPSAIIRRIEQSSNEAIHVCVEYPDLNVLGDVPSSLTDTTAKVQSKISVSPALVEQWLTENKDGKINDYLLSKIQADYLAKQGLLKFMETVTKGQTITW